MIAGFIPITGGEICVGGKPVKGPGPDRGVVFQSFALFPWRTVLDNVAFGPKMRGVGKAERDKIAHEYLALAKLTEAAERYPNELSGGMQQRVGVVRALANEPDVLLMDEPFASVDAQTRMTLQEELTRIWQEKRPTVIFITHDVAEAVFLANRVVVLSKGRVLEEIAVDLPRPRSWDALHEDARFKALTAACCNSCGRPDPCGATHSNPARPTCCSRSRCSISRGRCGSPSRRRARSGGLSPAAAKVNILVTLPFPPERFHVQLFQTYGRVSGTQDNAVEVRGVKRADLGLARPYWVKRVEPLPPEG